jgi:microcystin-dependent protein
VGLLLGVGLVIYGALDNQQNLVSTGVSIIAGAGVGAVSVVGMMIGHALTALAEVKVPAHTTIQTNSASGTITTAVKPAGVTVSTTTNNATTTTKPPINP